MVRRHRGPGRIKRRLAVILRQAGFGIDPEGLYDQKGSWRTGPSTTSTFTQPPSDSNVCGFVYYASVPMSRCPNAKPCADHPQAPPPPDDDDRALRLAWRFHDIYEALAPQFGYETRTETRKFDAESANGRLMIAVCRVVLHELKAAQ